MTLTPGQRIEMINECATLLDKSEWQDLDLILEMHSMPTTNSWTESRRAYVIAMIKNSKDKLLQDLHTYLTSESDHSSPGKSPFKGEGLRLFFSHLANHREVVGHVAIAVGALGIEGFVAHDSIDPGLEWQQVIEAALNDCDAMVVFLHPGLITSKWCDQEVGWALGRRRSLLPLNYGEHPYGFIGKIQDKSLEGVPANQVADAIFNWVSKTPTLQTRLATSIAHAFRHSWNFNSTRNLAAKLQSITNFSEDDLILLEEGAQVNSQIHDCDINGTQGPQWVATFVNSRRSPKV